ncbi:MULTISPECIES: pitrilysin family protein [unclassified Colwellia]|uniref:M16 family metallopeptidase n=1 Tax=unclassified Colwellia TaxID=196834 RepID=UPI0015F4002A|nr:insulinase family protein [Colwellia sp. BRX9-1]MBA6355814.1 insulinase family protein [Colwellia sp. BRX8-3]MBA6359467.1 insulinase family protein [Colwellia sp. BRX8-6]MBA6366144.1 insulinase family protein [Colwellia sp. BRX8-5]MBA6371941.1 insulinase family protein [Colwellia sp. BRX8-4]MBA6376528.1 insulinase family protein [Colwellia sp. BRX8-2]
MAEVTLPAGVNFVEQVTAEAGKTVIPYQKYTLSNGLTVILHKDASDPLVHVDMTYHVGSAREELGKSGFAHFFEHMMFQGSENVADEQHFKLITEAGGTLNGTTNGDRTNYFQTVPANQLEKMLWLESDRMGFLVDAVTQEKFEVQRETVKNERGQSYDNRPYGLLGERVAEALYPAGHPYSWQTIGYLEDLDRVNVNDLKAFFLKWYGPNNATLTIGGDIDAKETLALVEQYFGSIPRGPEIAMPEKPTFTINEDRYISMEDNVHLPLVYMSYPTVSVRHADEAPLDVLSSILGGGKTSLLYKNLVKNQLAVQASVGHPCAELACTFTLLALPHPASGKTLADIEKVIRDSLVEFEERGVQDDDLAKVKASMEASFIFGLQSVSGKVSTLAANQTFKGDPNYIEKDIARYANVTKADVMRVFKKYIKDQHAVIMSIVPKGKLDLIAAQDNFIPAPRSKGQTSETSAESLVVRKAQDNFDRSKMPISAANKSVAVPQMWNKTLANGIKVLGTQSIETPTTSLLLKIPAGHYYSDKDKAGVVSLLASALNESTTKRSAEEMSNELQKLGSSIAIYAGNQYLNVNVSTLTKNLDATMALVNEKLMHPAFIEVEFSRNKSNAIQGAINSKKDAGYLASTAYRQLLQADNIAATSSQGTEQSLNNITLADVKAFYEQQVKPSDSQLIVVSDLKEKALIKSLNVFSSWQGKGSSLVLTLAKPETKAGVIYLVNKEGAAQSAIRIGKRSMTQDITGEYYKSYLMNFTLGGAFNSRINLNLREDKGYTYGARSGFSADKFSGTFTASAEVRADVTDKSIIEFVNEIKGYNEQGITAEELSFMRNSINQRDALKYETPRAKLGFLAQILEYDLKPSFVQERAEIVETISAEEINTLAKKHLNLAEMLMVVVGDAKTLKPQLKALGYEVIDYEI